MGRHAPVTHSAGHQAGEGPPPFPPPPSIRSAFGDGASRAWRGCRRTARRTRIGGIAVQCALPRRRAQTAPAAAATTLPADRHLPRSPRSRRNRTTHDSVSGGRKDRARVGNLRESLGQRPVRYQCHLAIAARTASETSLTGLRCLARGLRVHPEVVERARNNRQSDSAHLDAVGGPAVVVTLAGGHRPDNQPHHKQYRCDSHCYLRKARSLDGSSAYYLRTRGQRRARRPGTDQPAPTPER
jgi:hypothetical protein